MGTKMIIEFGFRIILWRSRRVLSTSAKSASADNTLLDLHNSSDDTRPHPIIVK